jgi:hypothetical protein
MSQLERIVSWLRHLPRLFIAGSAAILLSACASVTPVIDGDSAQARAGNAIAQADIALTKGYRFVTDQAAAGVLFKSELQDVLAMLDKAAVLVEEAKALYDKGVFEGALDKVLDADKVLDYVEAEMAKKLRDRRQPVSMKAPMAEADANVVCDDQVIRFMLSYYVAKQERTEQQLLDQLTGANQEIVAAGQRFVRADFAGDKQEANAALNDLHKLCVKHHAHPEVQV